jgi:hypothetical protein
VGEIRAILEGSEAEKGRTSTGQCEIGPSLETKEIDSAVIHELTEKLYVPPNNAAASPGEIG